MLLYILIHCPIEVKYCYRRNRALLLLYLAGSADSTLWCGHIAGTHIVDWAVRLPLSRWDQIRKDSSILTAKILQRHYCVSAELKSFSLRSYFEEHIYLLEGKN